MSICKVNIQRRGVCVCVCVCVCVWIYACSLLTSLNFVDLHYLAAHIRQLQHAPCSSRKAPLEKILPYWLCLQVDKTKFRLSCRTGCQHWVPDVDGVQHVDVVRSLQHRQTSRAAPLVSRRLRSQSYVTGVFCNFHHTSVSRNHTQPTRARRAEVGFTAILPKGTRLRVDAAPPFRAPHFPSEATHVYRLLSIYQHFDSMFSLFCCSFVEQYVYGVSYQLLYPIGCLVCIFIGSIASLLTGQWQN